MPSDPESSRDDDDFIDRWADPETIFGDPEKRFGNPEQSDLIPDVAPDTSEAETAAEPDLSTSFSEVDSDVLNRFIVILLLIKVGIILLSAGILLIAFRSLLELGGGVIAIGLLAFLRAGQHYWAHIHAASDNEHTEAASTDGANSADAEHGDEDDEDDVEYNDDEVDDTADHDTAGRNG